MQNWNAILLRSNDFIVLVQGFSTVAYIFLTLLVQTVQKYSNLAISRAIAIKEDFCEHSSSFFASLEKE